MFLLALLQTHQKYRPRATHQLILSSPRLLSENMFLAVRHSVFNQTRTDFTVFLFTSWWQHFHAASEMERGPKRNVLNSISITSSWRPCPQDLNLHHWQLPRQHSIIPLSTVLAKCCCDWLSSHHPPAVLKLSPTSPLVGDHSNLIVVALGVSAVAQLLLFFPLFIYFYISCDTVLLCCDHQPRNQEDFFMVCHSVHPALFELSLATKNKNVLSSSYARSTILHMWKCKNCTQGI